MKNFIKYYFKNLSWRGVLNWVMGSLLVLALIRTCITERKFDKLVAEHSQAAPVPETPATHVAEEISREVANTGKELVIYRLSEPLRANQELRDSFARVAAVDKKKLQEAVEIQASLRKQNTELIRNISSLDTNWSYSDPWLHINAVKKDTNFVIKDLKADIAVSKVDHSRRKFWVFGREEALSTIWFDSPYATVNGLRTLTVTNREPLLSFEASAEAKYLQQSKQLLLGPSIRLGVGRVGLLGGYYLNPLHPLDNGKNSYWYGVDYRFFLICT